MFYTVVSLTTNFVFDSHLFLARFSLVCFFNVNASIVTDWQTFMAGMVAFFIITVSSQSISVPRVCSSLIYYEHLNVRHEQVFDKHGSKQKTNEM